MYSELVLQTDVDLLARLNQVGAQIGRTPLRPVTGVFSSKYVRLFAKVEWQQLSGSIKARAAFQIIRAAILGGRLHRGKTLLDATSGNTGIAYSAIAKALGIPVALCLPENASTERKEILRSLGAEIIFTSRFEGTDGAQQVARELAAERPDRYFYADQYKNEHNWQAHFRHTAAEIWQALDPAKRHRDLEPRKRNFAEKAPWRDPVRNHADLHFVAGLGTTGTFVGTGRGLREYDPSVRLTALQPDSALHGLEGWKHLETALVPGIYDPNLADAFLEIDTAEAYEMIRAAKKHEGLLLSPSAAANLAGAVRVAEKLDAGTVVTVFPDNADKYGDIIKQLF